MTRELNVRITLEEESAEFTASDVKNLIEMGLVTDWEMPSVCKSRP